MLNNIYKKGNTNKNGDIEIKLGILVH